MRLCGPEAKALLIDTGTATNAPDLDRALNGQGKGLDQVELVVNTHAHPDHIGSNRHLAELCAPALAAHPAAARWIEDPELHNMDPPPVMAMTMQSVASHLG